MGGKEEEIKEEGREDRGKKGIRENKMSEWGKEMIKKEAIYYKIRGETEKKKILLLKEGNAFCRREKEMAFENKSTKSDKFLNDRLHQFIKGVFKII